MSVASKEAALFLAKGYVGQHLSQLNRSDNAIFNFQLSSAMSATVEECVQYIRDNDLKCVIPTSDDGLMTAGAVNQKLGFPTPTFLSLIACTNKNLTRTLLGKFGWFYGFNLDQQLEQILENVRSFPCMLKATMLSRGNLTFRCDNKATLFSNLETIKADHILREKNSSLCSEAISILKESGKTELVDKCTECMVEEYIDMSNEGTYQYCMEGFISGDGRVLTYSLVEEIFFKNGKMLGHVMPPIHFNGNFKPFESLLERVGKKLSDLGFQNQAFDIEFWQLSDGSFVIIEVNPRMAASYYDLYWQYCGNNIYQDVASFVQLGVEPEKSPLSHLKHMWSISGHNHTHSFQIGLTTRAKGKVGDVLDIDFLQDQITKGLAGFIRLSKDAILGEVNSTSHGTIAANVTLKGPWDEIIKKVKQLRESFYKEEYFHEADNYPDCFKCYS